MSQTNPTSKNHVDLESIRHRHRHVENSGDPSLTAQRMGYLSHLDRGELLAEIERLTRERDVWKAKAVHRGESASRLRAALAGAVELIEKTEWLAFSLGDRAKLDAAREALSGEHSAPRDET